MAKKKTTRRPPTAAKNDHPQPAADEELDQTVDQAPEVRKAAEAVRRAKAEFQKAQTLYQKVREEAVEKLKGVREKRVGELIDGTLEAVRRHPGLGVIVAAVIGFFFGRMFRR